MTVPAIQTSFSAGEITPELYGEVDLAKAHTAATTLRNAFVNYRGGAISRGGFAFVGRCKQSVSGTGPPRPIPFQFSNNQGYVLEFGDQYMRIVYNGGYVLESPVLITGATNANPCTISVTGTPFINGDWVYASGAGGMTQLNGNTYIVAGATGGSFTLTDLNGVPVNSSSFGTWTSGGTFSRLYTLSTPYAAVDLPYLKFAQTADVMSLTCVNPITGNEYPPYDLTRISAIDWTIEQTNYDPAISPPSSVSATAAFGAPSTGVNACFAYQVTAVDAQGNESIASAIAQAHGADIQVEGGSNTITWSPISGAAYYNVYRSPASTDNTASDMSQPINWVPAGSILGFVGSSYGTQFVDSNTTPDLTKTPPTHANPFARGQILAVNITGQGGGLSSVGYSITSATGSNFAGTTAVISGGLGAFLIQNNGKNYLAGDSIAFNGAGFASGAIEFGSTNPSNGDTITLNGVVWTFVSTLTGANQTKIGGSLASTLVSLAANLSASSSASLIVASYSIDTTNSNLLISYKTAGTPGNAYTLAASRATPSGATLSGGSGSGSAGAAATGSLTFVGNPTNGLTIVLNGLTWTFVTGAASGNQTQIQASLSSTLTQLASNLNASSATQINVASYAATTTALNIAYAAIGATGNTYTLGAGTSGATVSGPTLAGGINAATVPTAALKIGPNSGTYPGVNAYFQERHFFANSFNNPDTLWATKTGLYQSMDTSVPAVATDAITASPWTEQVNGIQWLIPMPGGLIAMTGLRAWQINGEGSQGLNLAAITPSSVQAQPQAFNGCSATIPPLVIDYDVIYVQAIGNTTVFDLSWNFWVNIYTGNDLTILSSHLFLYRQIVQWAWARQPYKVLWANCNDGTMLSLTYLKDQNVYGWARHDTQGLVMGLCQVTEPPVNAVYAITQRFPPYAPQGIYVMERMDNRLWQSVEDTFALDCAVSNPMSSPAVSLSASANSGAGVTFTSSGAVFAAGNVGQVIRMCGGIASITGFVDSEHVIGTWNLAASNGPPGFPYAPSGSWTLAAPVTTLSAPHLAGMKVSALADGIPLSGLAVSSSGLITLPFPASNVKAGLPYTVQIQTPYLNGEGVVQGARKVIPAATARVAASGPFQMGTNQPDAPAQNPPVQAATWSNMSSTNPLRPTGNQKPAQQYTSPGGQTVTPLWTGDVRQIGSGAEWTNKGQVAIQQVLPLPLQVTAIMPEFLEGDTPDIQVRQKDAGAGQAESGQQPPQGPGAWMLKGGGRI